jgi:serine/threonine-protein kinase
MSDSTVKSDAGDRNLLFGVLALQLNFVSPTALRHAIEAWETDRTRSLAQVLVEHNALPPSRRVLMDELLREYLAQHNMDVARGLAAACAPRSMPIEIARLVGPALRGGVATLPSSEATLSGSDARNGSAAEAIALLADRRFRVLRPHARGALGEVFVAHDEELNREVALKEIQEPYAHHPDSRARFILEAEITGSLEHPGIVPVYSLGTHADGRPFYAMRFIKGESLHDAIARFHEADHSERDSTERALSLRGLLSRFVAVCNAISYAHARGVIHRDIKPSNIMLGPYGETLVVDWGLAKAFDQPMTPDSVELPIHPSSTTTQATILGQAVGTPAFMPPEQASGRIDQIGPPSDVYALGATLYNLLTGDAPFSGSASEVLRLVQTHSFLPPRRVNRLVPRPLEAIVLRAMAFRPEERYASVTELAQEVERWLADEPVRAYRESLVEGTQRWMRRHRPAVFGLGALVLTAMVALAVGLWAVNREQRRTALERDNAEENLRQAKQAVDDCFVLATRAPLLQEERNREVRELLLKQALPFYENFRIQRPDDEALHTETAENHFRVAIITEVIGNKTKALESYEKARKVFATLLSQHPQTDEYRINLARIMNNLGTLQRDTGDRAKALVSLEQARKLRDELAGKYPHSFEHLSDLATTYNNLGVLFRDLKKPREALENYELARDLLVRLVRDDAREDRHQANLAATYHNLGRLLAEHDDVESAFKAYEDAREIRQKLAKKYEDSSKHRADLASTLLNLGALLHAEQPDRARDVYEQARQVCERLVTEPSRVAEFHADLGRACNGLGVILRKPGATTDSIKWHKQAAAIFERLVKEHETEGEYRLALAGTCVNLGHALRDGNQAREALPCYEKAFVGIRELEKRGADLPEMQEVLRNAYWGRAETLGKLDRYREAIPDWQMAVKLSRPGDRDRDLIRQGQAAALAQAGMHRQALVEVEDLLKGKLVKPDLFYELACVCALAARATDRDKTLSQADRGQLIDQYAARAIALLEQAKNARFFHDPKWRAHLKKDPDFEFLRSRRDYQRFIEELDKNK